MDFLEYSDITAEIKGSMTPGKLKMTDQSIIFKNSKTGKVEQIGATDMELANFQNFVGSWGLRIFLKNGTLHRFGGFKDGEKEKVAKYFSSNYKINMLEKELSLKGWNWGTAKFNGSVLSFDVGSNTSFEIPLNHVSQCNTGKNEITLEFHQNDDAPVSLMEMRFFIPSNELAGDLDPVEAFHQQVMNKASVISVSGDAIAIFREIQCLTPRGRYDIKIFQSFFQLHGKTFDYKIPMSTVLRLFVLPHKDSRQMFFVVSLDPPIKQGQTRYHFLVLLFGQEEETSIELPFTDEELAEKYENKLTKELTGPTYEVLGKVMKVIINRKLTGPGAFIGHSGTPAVGCSFKAAAGYLYPLERGFIYVHKPPIHIRFEEITSVNFARGGGNTRSFDFEVELKSGTIHTFSSIEKEEYGKLFDFISSKKLHMKNRGKNDKANFKDDFGDSDNEKEPDAYLARVKAEAKERDEMDDDQNSDDDESTDEDFNPNQELSDVAEEYDSKHSDTESDESGEGGGDKEGEDGKKEKKHKEKKEKKHRSSKTVSERPRKKRSVKDKDKNRPKRPSTAFMLWLNETREQIKSENPGIKVTEIAKKAGEMWKEIKDKTEWDNKAAKAKEEYAIAIKEYEDSGGAAKFAAEKKERKDKEKEKTKSSETKKTVSKPKSAAAASSPVKSGAFKSKEYVSDDSSSDDEKKKPNKRKGSDKDSGSENEKKKKKESPKKKSSDEENSEDDKDKSKDSDVESDTDKKKAKVPEKTTKKKTESAKKKSSDEENSEDDDKDKSKDSDVESDSDKKKAKKPVEKKSIKKKASPKKKSSDEDNSEDEKDKSKDSDAESDTDKKKSKTSDKKSKGNDSESEEILSTPPSSGADADSDSD